MDKGAVAMVADRGCRCGQYCYIGERVTKNYYKIGATME